MESNSNNKQKVSNFEKGLKLVREGNLHQADICFDAEMTQSNRPNFNVFIYHGHLLNRLGRYDEAIAKFNSFLNNHDKDVSCLFGKGISNIGLLNLDDALSLFEEVIDIYPNHADAYFYSAIIYCYPFYQNYNLSKAKDAYEKYQKLREDFFNNNPKYFDLLGDDLSQDKLMEYYDEIHNFYKLTDSFIAINQLLEREGADNSNEYSYKQLSLLSGADEKEVEDLFEIVGYDEKLIDDLYLKFNKKDDENKRTLNNENKRTLNKIFYRSMDYDISFRDLHDLIRVNVLDGNESIDSFYERLEDFIKSRVNEKNRELNRVEGDNEKLKKEMDDLEKNIKSLVNENWDLNNKLKISEEKNWDLNNKINVLKEKNGELSNKLNDISTDTKLSIFGDDFKYASSMNKLYGISHEDYQEDLEILISKNYIPEDECIDFETAFDEYDAGNFDEAYELFDKFSDNFKWPREYINFLKATSLSSDNKIQKAYEMIHLNFQKTTELGKKYNKDKYPILWFNFGNIYFDYINSKPDNMPKYLLQFPSYCYKNALKIVSEKKSNSKSKSKSKSNYKFNFENKGSKEEFENNVKMMLGRAEICENLLKIEELKKKKENK